MEEKPLQNSPPKNARHPRGFSIAFAILGLAMFLFASLSFRNGEILDVIVGSFGGFLNCGYVAWDAKWPTKSRREESPP